MESNYESIYKISRKNTRKTLGYVLTQEELAELILVSIDSLRDYEQLRTIPSNLMALRISEVCKDPELILEHWTRYDPIGKHYFPEPYVRGNSLLKNAVSIEMLSEKLVAMKNDLKIAAMDENFENESPDFLIQLKSVCVNLNMTLMDMTPKVMAACTIMGIS